MPKSTKTLERERNSIHTRTIEHIFGRLLKRDYDELSKNENFANFETGELGEFDVKALRGVYEGNGNQKYAVLIEVKSGYNGKAFRKACSQLRKAEERVRQDYPDIRCFKFVVCSDRIKRKKGFERPYKFYRIPSEN